jgi:hypothetical protein
MAVQRVFQLTRRARISIVKGSRAQGRHDLLSAPKKYGHYKGMREPDFYAIHEAVSCTLDDGEVIMESGT